MPSRNSFDSLNLFHFIFLLDFLSLRNFSIKNIMGWRKPFWACNRTYQSPTDNNKTTLYIERDLSLSDGRQKGPKRYQHCRKMQEARGRMTRWRCIEGKDLTDTDWIKGGPLILMSVILGPFMNHPLDADVERNCSNWMTPELLFSFSVVNCIWGSLTHKFKNYFMQ